MFSLVCSDHSQSTCPRKLSPQQDAAITISDRKDGNYKVVLSSPFSSADAGGSGIVSFYLYLIWHWEFARNYTKSCSEGNLLPLSRLSWPFNHLMTFVLQLCHKSDSFPIKGLWISLFRPFIDHSAFAFLFYKMFQRVLRFLGRSIPERF